jgi:4-carboxymuconolactone decarboxylase
MTVEHTSMIPDELRQRGEARWREMLGPEQAERVRAKWRDVHPDFEAYVTGFLGGEIWSRPQLDLRTKSLTTIVVLAALGRGLALELNIRLALNNGATRQDIVEVFLHNAPFFGFPACWEALAVAQNVFRDLDKGQPAS